MTGVAQTTADSKWLYCQRHHAQTLVLQTRVQPFRFAICSNIACRHMHNTYYYYYYMHNTPTSTRRETCSSKGFASRLQIACTARQLQADMRNPMGSKCADKCFCYCSKRASAAQEEDTHKAFCAAAAGQHGSNGPSGPCWLAIT